MELREKVLEAMQRTLGGEHPSTLRAMGNLATSYRQLRRTQEAMELDEKVLEASQKTLGRDHPETITAMVTLPTPFATWDACRKA